MIAAVAVAAAIGTTVNLDAFASTGPSPVSGLSVIDTATRTPITGLDPIAAGAVAEIAGRHVTVQAGLTPGAIAGSIAFKLTGGALTEPYRHTQNTAPYHLCDDYKECAALSVPGDYRVRVQAYSGPDTGGEPLGDPVVVTFRVAEPLDVLVVGNSLVGTESAASGQDTIEATEALAAGAGRGLRVTRVIHFGNTLKQTWDGGEVAPALADGRRYDRILLQEQSTLVAKNFVAAESALLQTYAPALTGALKPGGKILLFKNWALAGNAGFPSRAANVAAIDTGYAKLAAELTLPNETVPVSDAFEKIIATEGTAELIVEDGRHPNDRAIYLDATMLYGVLFQASPATVGDLYLSAADAAGLRAVAAEVLGK